MYFFPDYFGNISLDLKKLQYDQKRCVSQFSSEFAGNLICGFTVIFRESAKYIDLLLNSENSVMV